MIYRKPVPDQVEIGFWIMVEHQTSGTFVLVVGRVMRYLVCNETSLHNERAAGLASP